MPLAQHLELDHGYTPGYIGRLPLPPVGDLAPFDLLQQLPSIDFVEGIESFDKILAERHGADPRHAQIGHVTLSRSVVDEGGYIVRSLLRRQNTTANDQSATKRIREGGRRPYEAINFLETIDHALLLGHRHLFYVSNTFTREGQAEPLTQRQAGFLLELSKIARQL